MLQRFETNNRGKYIVAVRLDASDVGHSYDWKQFKEFFMKRTAGVKAMYLTGVREPAVVIQYTSPIAALVDNRTRDRRFQTVNVGQWVYWRGLSSVGPALVVNSLEEAMTKW